MPLASRLASVHSMSFADSTVWYLNGFAVVVTGKSDDVFIEAI